MTTTPAVFYDWPRAIVPFNDLYFAGGSATEGLLTLKAVRKSSPEPGGRAYLDMEFNTFGGMDDPRMVAWLISRIRNGAYMRVRICNRAQLVPYADLGLAPTTAELTHGIPFEEDGGIESYFDDGTGFEYEPIASAAEAALEGVMQIVIDMGELLPGLQFGHLLGHMGASYMIMGVVYAGRFATVELSQPLRHAMSPGDIVTFRPWFIGFAEDPDAMIAAISAIGTVRPGKVRMIEAWI